MLARIAEYIVEFLDRFVPAELRESVEVCRRARLLVAMLVLGTVILAATAFTNLVLGLDGRMALIHLLWAGLLQSLLLVLRKTASLAIVANCIVAAVFLLILIPSSLSGGRNIGALFAYSAIPMLAVLMAGWRSGLVFTGLSAFAILTIPVLPFQIFLPSDLPPGPIPPVLVRDALNVTLAVGILSALYDAVRGLTLRDAETARVRAEQSESSVREFSQRQSELLHLIRGLQDATPESFEAEIDQVMEWATRLAGADRSVLRLMDGPEFSARYEWSAEDFDRHSPGLSVAEGRREFPWTAERIMRGEVAQIVDPAGLPEEAAAERAFLSERGIQSWLCVPVRAGRRPVGYQSFECIAHRKQWSENEVSALSLMTEVLASAVLRHRSETALRVSEQKFAGAFRDHPDAMLIIAMEDATVLECNEQLLREVGAAGRFEVVGRKVWDFDFTLVDEQSELLERVLRTDGGTPGVELDVRGPLGDRVYLVALAQIDVDGRPSILASAHNLTERKQLEQRLQQSQKMEAVGRLAGGIAHDFNNMLTVISGYSCNLIRQLEGEALADAEAIRDAARRSSDLTRQLLAFSRRQIFNIEALDLNSVVSGLDKMLRPLVGESIELGIALGDLPGQVQADRGQLEQAIVNLVVNARDAMSEGGPIAIRTEVAKVDGTQDMLGELELGSYATLSVEDVGEGMASDLTAHVMEPFYTTKPEGKGTGLGLPMAHGIARQCGGTLVLESEPGRGTRATIYLPLAEQQAVASVAEAAPSTSDVREASRVILLAEDEPLVRRLAARILRNCGHQVIEAEDGAEALARARELGSGLDLIVSDVVMPGVSGIELFRRLREERPEVPFLLMSGYPEPAGEGQLLPDEAAFILKPFEAGELSEAVESVLSESNLRPVDAGAPRK